MVNICLLNEGRKEWGNPRSWPLSHRVLFIRPCRGPDWFGSFSMMSSAVAQTLHGPYVTLIYVTFVLVGMNHGNTVRSKCYCYLCLPFVSPSPAPKPPFTLMCFSHKATIPLLCGRGRAVWYRGRSPWKTAPSSLLGDFHDL